MRISDLPRDKHFRFFEFAYHAALLSPGIQGRFRLGSVLIKGKSILSMGNNSYKTNPNLLKLYHWPFIHAESGAILSAGMDNCEGGTLYVLRVKQDKSLGMAKPCLSCESLIRATGIKRVFYTTGIVEQPLLHYSL